MPTVTVNKDGAQLFYLDSGLLQDAQNSTTLFIIHGLGWSGEIFKKVIDIAPRYGLRVVAVNRRDYQGSTPFSPEELSQFSEEASLRQFLRDRSIEFAEVLQHLVDQGGIHKPKNGKGGVVFMGWSMGNVFGLDFVAQAPTFPDSLRDLVKTYVKSYILFDPSSTCFALPSFQAASEQQRIAAANPDPAKAEDALQDWICGWFSYPVDEKDPVKRYVEPTQHPIRESTWRAEASNPDFMKCYASAATSRNEVAMVRGPFSKEVITSTSESTVFNKSDPCPGMELKFVYCENSCWTCFFAGEKIEEIWKEKSIERPIIMVRGANHFLQWEDPEKFLKSIIPLL